MFFVNLQGENTAT